MDPRNDRVFLALQVRPLPWAWPGPQRASLVGPREPQGLGIRLDSSELLSNQTLNVGLPVASLCAERGL